MCSSVAKNLGKESDKERQRREKDAAREMRARTSLVLADGGVRRPGRRRLLSPAISRCRALNGIKNISPGIISGYLPAVLAARREDVVAGIAPGRRDECPTAILMVGEIQR